MERNRKQENISAFLFIILPIVFTIIGAMFFPVAHPGEERLTATISSIPLFIGLILLLIGFLFHKERIAIKIKIIGWVFFAFFWSTQINSLYFGVDGDIVNLFLCIVGIFVLFYLVYHEWLSLIRKEKISCLNWAAGAAAIAGLIYFVVEKTPLEMWLREVVAAQSAALLNFFTGGVVVDGIHISYELAHIEIIFACTAVQSMVIFVGMMIPLAGVSKKKRAYGLLVTVVPVYFLNLIRNALVTFLVGKNGHDYFGTAHNVIGKGGSLIALIVLIFIVIKIVPEVFDEIICLTDLPKRNGPLEKFVNNITRRKK